MVTKKSVFFEEQTQKERLFVSDSIADKIDIPAEHSGPDDYVLMGSSRFPMRVVSIKNKNGRILVGCIVKVPTFTQFAGSKNSTVSIDGISYECELRSLKVFKKNTEDGLLTISILNA